MSFCAFPAFDFAFTLPVAVPGLPSLPPLSIPLLFSMPACPLD